MQQTDVAVIGGGIVGLATAYRLQERFPDLAVTVLEKEADVGQHQSGRNSGVLHSGIYYTPGSLKAQNCRAGKKAMEAFCEAEGVAYDRCGKVIVATCEAELPTLEQIFANGQANGVECEMIGPERLNEIEPHATGVRAIHVPESGIVDYPAVCRRLAERIRARGGQITTRACVRTIHHVDGRHADGRVALDYEDGSLSARCVVNCAGLWSDRVTKMSGQRPGIKIVPFRGEYYELVPEARRLCNGLIYPVPDPSFPFLGVHLTCTVDGRVECGPNAVLAFAREGYTKGTIRWKELFETLTYPGFLHLARRYWRTGFSEMQRSFRKAAFARALQKLVPEVRAEHLRAAPAGVRAQALRPNGDLVDDFLIRESEHIINVCNAPSPAATASLNIGALIVDKLEARL